MTSSFCNVGLADIWKAALGVQPGAVPSQCNLIAESFTPGPTLTYGALAWAAGTNAKSVTASWSFTLNATGNYVTASATLTWNFTAAQAGQVFYGVGLYDVHSNELFYIEQFPAPYQVPATGGVLTWTFNLNFGDCASV